MCVWALGVCRQRIVWQQQTQVTLALLHKCLMCSYFLTGVFRKISVTNSSKELSLFYESSTIRTFSIHFALHSCYYYCSFRVRFPPFFSLNLCVREALCVHRESCTHVHNRYVYVACLLQWQHVHRPAPDNGRGERYYIKFIIIFFQVVDTCARASQ